MIALLWFFFFDAAPPPVATARFTRVAAGAGAFYVRLAALRTYVALMPGTNMPALQDFPPMDAVIQRQTVAFDWGNFLPEGVTLTGVPNATLTVAYGTDANVGQRIGKPQVGTVPTAQNGSGVTNAAALVQLNQLQPEVTYLLVMYCSRSDGDVASGWAHVTGVNPV